MANDRVRYQSFVADSSRWDGFEHRSGDIVISSPPKSGTTVTQMLCALLIFDGPDFPGTLDELSPWLDVKTWPLEEMRTRLASQQHRRFIKTHTPLDGLPLDDSVTYLVVGRDPRDAAISWEHHFANMNLETLAAHIAAASGADPTEPAASPPPIVDDAERWRQFVEDAAPTSPDVLGLARVLHHLSTGWEMRDAANVELFHFSDYQEDLTAELGRLAATLGIEMENQRLEDLAAEASIDRMRDRAHEVSPDTTKNHWKDTRRFFRSGASGEWRERTSAADLLRYQVRLTELVASDLSDWAHNGWLAAGRGIS